MFPASSSASSRPSTLVRGPSRRLATAWLPAAVLTLCAGCAVPQPRGSGELLRKQEPETGRRYWLYLPEAYVEAGQTGRQARRWPVVVTLHGMKPFDSSYPQAREWEKEADRWGLLVIAPDLVAPSVLRQFPVRNVTRAFKSDELATLAILEHVFATTQADSDHVFVTSWSSGGFLAHYMLNQHPDVFTALGVRQSNFSESILDPDMTRQSVDNPVLILSTQNDFGGVKRESHRAIKWYENHGYTNFAWVEIKNLGHERTPDMAAAFFAQVAGLEPLEPPTALARRQAIGGNARGLALLAGEDNESEAATEARRAPAPRRSAPAGAGGERTESRRTTRAQPPRATPPSGRAHTARESTVPVTPARGRGPERNHPPLTNVSIRVSSAIGTDPLVVAFSAECPVDWQRRAEFLWTLNGDPIAEGISGRETITEPGEHTLGLLVVGPDRREHRAYRLIRVLPDAQSSRQP